MVSLDLYTATNLNLKLVMEKEADLVQLFGPSSAQLSLLCANRLVMEWNLLHPSLNYQFCFIGYLFVNNDDIVQGSDNFNTSGESLIPNFQEFTRQ